MGIIYKNGIPYGNQPSIDATLTHQGEAADAKAVGDEISGVKNTLNHKADVIYDTASGDIASFPDGADGLPVKDLTVGIEPVQDLHGQANPYPQGGGKQLIPMTVENIKAVNTTGSWSGNSWTKNEVTFKIETDESENVIGIKVNGAATSDTYFHLSIPSSSLYSASCKASLSSNIAPCYFIDSYSGKINIQAGEQSLTGGSLTIEPSIKVGNGISVSNVLVKPMIRLSTVSDATFAPYSNICPISGWNGANVSRTGFNVWDEEWEVGGIGLYTGENENDPSLIRSKNFIPIIPNAVYYIHCGSLTNSTARCRYYDKDKNYLGYAPSLSLNQLGTMPSNAHYFRFVMQAEYGTTYKHDICINISDPAKNGTYEPGHVVTLPISWQSEAGTVYGGTLDATSGVLTVADANIASYNGETLPGEWISDRDVYSAGATPTTGAQVVYKLASPQTYQLDPVTVNTLLGQNNVWADCGPSTVEYPCDTKLYIQKINTPTDDDMIADAQIASGKYFIVNNNLYISTAAILAGDPIKPGTNCTLTNLAAALNALNS